MNTNVSKRITARVIATLCLAAVLALIPPMIYHNPLYSVFYLDDAAKEIGSQFSDNTRWIHLGAIIAVWLLNLLFFITNEKKGDSGRTLERRTSLQGTLNFLLLVVCVAAMIGYRFMISGDAWIGTYLPNAQTSILTLFSPYYTVAICVVILWAFCMRAAPATNCAVRCAIPRWFDDKMKRAPRSR
jgi:hypothetical protein